MAATSSTGSTIEATTSASPAALVSSSGASNAVISMPMTSARSATSPSSIRSPPSDSPPVTGNCAGKTDGSSTSRSRWT